MPFFNKISWLCGQQAREDKTSNEGCNSRPTWHDFIDNFNVWIKLYQTKKIPLGMNKCNGSIGGGKQQTKVCPKFSIKWYQSILILHIQVHTHWNRIYHINIGHDPCCGLTTKFGECKLGECPKT
jgi:hypothetical protein